MSTQKTLVSLEETIRQMHGNVQEITKISIGCRKVSAVIGAEAAAADTFLAQTIIGCNHMLLIAAMIFACLLCSFETQIVRTETQKPHLMTSRSSGDISPGSYHKNPTQHCGKMPSCKAFHGISWHFRLQGVVDNSFGFAYQIVVQLFGWCLWGFVCLANSKLKSRRTWKNTLFCALILSCLWQIVIL